MKSIMFLVFFFKTDYQDQIFVIIGTCLLNSYLNEVQQNSEVGRCTT